RPAPEVRELLHAHLPAPPELFDDDGPLQRDLGSLFVVERNRPSPELVESFEGLDKMAEERVPSLLAVGDHVEPRGLLDGCRVVEGPVLDALEPGVGEVASLDALARVDQVRGTQETANALAAVHEHRERLPVDGERSIDARRRMSMPNATCRMPNA